MTALVVGASGATGRLLVEQLLHRGCSLKALVRPPDRLPSAIRDHERLAVVCASILNLSEAELIQPVSGCGAVASCLDHAISIKGIYGQPRRLVTDATRQLCSAIREAHAGTRTRFVLMNTAGDRNPDLNEPLPLRERIALGLLRLLVPPHTDNKEAAEYLRTDVGRNDGVIEWTVVRPDTLTNEEQVTDYDVYSSPTRSAIFNAARPVA